MARTHVAGTTATFSVLASGTPPPNYQWRFNSTNLTDGARINGATSTNLTIGNVQSSDAGSYTAVITNVAGSITSDVATLTMIAGGVNTNATNIQATLTGDGLQLAWPDDHTGWRLLMQTNPPGAGLGTNWQEVPASATTNRLWFQLDASRGSVFFRLVYP